MQYGGSLGFRAKFQVCWWFDHAERQMSAALPRLARIKQGLQNVQNEAFIGFAQSTGYGVFEEKATPWHTAGAEFVVDRVGLD